MSPRHLVILVALLIGLGAAAWLVTPAAAQTQPSPPFDLSQVPPPAGPPAALFGEGLYLQNCAPCHGDTGNADGPAAASLPGPPTAFADPAATWELSPAQLFHTTKFGRIEALMPPWGNQLTDDQIWQAVTYAWTLHTSQAEIAAGEALYTANCAACHGERGAGDGPEAPRELPDLGDPAYAMTVSQADWLAGWQAAHPELGADWAQAEQAQVLETIRSFSYVPLWETALPVGHGEVTGRVLQGTPGGPDPAGATVTLEAYVNFTPAAAFTATTAVDGSFVFTDLAVDPSIVYLASAPAAGLEFSSPLIALSASQPMTETVITVYEPTDDPTGIVIDRAHWIVDSQPGAVIAGQIVFVGSDADHAYTGRMVEGIDVPVTVELTVPEGAQQVSFDGGELGARFRQAGNRVYDTLPVIPGDGTGQIIMRYAIPYDGTAVELAQEFAYPVKSLDLLISEVPGLQSDVPALVSGGVQQFEGGQNYQVWRGDALEPGVVNVSLTGLLPPGAIDPRQAGDATGAPAAGAPATGATETGAIIPDTVALLDQWMVWFSAGIVILGLIGAVAWAWQQGRFTGGDSATELGRQRDDLLRRIAHLDDLRALGEVGDEAWQAQRVQLKAQLLEVSARLEQPAV